MLMVLGEGSSEGALVVGLQSVEIRMLSVRGGVSKFDENWNVSSFPSHVSGTIVQLSEIKLDVCP